MTPIEPTTQRAWVGWVLLAVAVTVLGWGAIRLAPAGTHVAAWWPAVGVAVAAGLRARQHGVAGAALATLAGSLAANLLGGREPTPAVAFSAANTLEVVVVCLLVLRWGPGPRLGALGAGLRVAAALVVGAVLAGTTIGLIIQVTGGAGVVAARAVAMSHLSALVLFLPFAIREWHLPSQAGRAERVATALVLVLATLLVFAPGQALPVIFLVFPMLAFTAFRQSLTCCAAMLVLVNLTATGASAAGWGPLVGAVRGADLPPETTAMLLQVLIVSTAVMVFALRLTVEARVEALASATRAGRHLQAVIEAAPTAIIQVDLDGVIQVFNQGAVDMLGHAEADVVGVHTPQLFHDPDEVAARAAELGIEPGFEVFVRDVRARRRQSERRDWTYVGADGTRRTVSLVVSRVEDAHGEIIGFLGIAEDVTSQRRVEQLLVQSLQHERALAQRLREADVLKNDFVTSVSHELRTPMTSVVGYAEMLADTYGDALGESGTRVIDKIQANGLRLLHLVDDLLTLSRVDAPAFVLEEERVDLRELVHSAVAVMHPLVDSHGLHLSIVDDEAAACVVGDAVEIERVLVNLLANAVKFTRTGGSVVIALESPQPDVVAVTVTDTGIGIPADDLPHVFARFHRAANTVESATPGTGLGLAIVRTVVERHGGTIEIDSSEGYGTRVTVLLPREPATVAPREPVVVEDGVPGLRAVPEHELPG